MDNNIDRLIEVLLCKSFYKEQEMSKLEADELTNYLINKKNFLRTAIEAGIENVDIDEVDEAYLLKFCIYLNEVETDFIKTFKINK